ncbi:hypothetical protein SK128_014014 [Halocaridina rubra]|uniref:Uncharacterized protein n=1 Tax=Halocaridina rubra TaxID=373956 RepID=A0AAN8WVB9_HALRR
MSGNLQVTENWLDNGALVSAIQGNVEMAVTKNYVYSALSLDTIRHAIKGLTKMGAVTRSYGSDGQKLLIPEENELRFVTEALKRIDFSSLQAKL